MCTLARTNPNAFAELTALHIAATSLSPSHKIRHYSGTYTNLKPLLTLQCLEQVTLSGFRSDLLIEYIRSSIHGLNQFKFHGLSILSEGIAFPSASELDLKHTPPEWPLYRPSSKDMTGFPDIEPGEDHKSQISLILAAIVAKQKMCTSIETIGFDVERRDLLTVLLPDYDDKPHAATPDDLHDPLHWETPLNLKNSAVVASLKVPLAQEKETMADFTSLDTLANFPSLKHVSLHCQHSHDDRMWFFLRRDVVATFVYLRDQLPARNFQSLSVQEGGDLYYWTDWEQGPGRASLSYVPPGRGHACELWDTDNLTLLQWDWQKAEKTNWRPHMEWSNYKRGL
jgi:hypothetical protein